MEWYPADGADQYRVNDLTTNQVYFVTEPQIWVNMDAGATHNFEVSRKIYLGFNKDLSIFLPTEVSYFKRIAVDKLHFRETSI